MIQPWYDPEVLLKVIDEAHYHFVTPLEARVLAAAHLGYSNVEIAEAMRLEAGTVRRHVASVCHQVFDQTDLPPERAKLRTWIPRHFTCCTLAVEALLKNGRIFA